MSSASRQPSDEPIDLRRYSSSLRPDADGIWRAGCVTAVSYPDEGNRFCAALEVDSFWFEHRNGIIVDAVRRRPPTGPIFDVGGGNGAVAAALQAASLQVVLVEPGTDGIHNAARRGIAHLAQTTFGEAGFLPGALPAVGVFDVIEHIEHDLAFLAAVRGALAPEGRLYLTVPAHPWLWSDEDRSSGHFRRYSRSALRSALTGAGFHVEWLSHFFVWLPVPIWLRRTIRGRGSQRRATDLSRVPAQHRLPRGFTGRLLASALRAERSALAGGRRELTFGSSLIAVASR